MKMKLIPVLNILGLLMVVMSLFIYMEIFSKEVLESIRLLVMSAYVYTALFLPWWLKTPRKRRIISFMGMFAYPIGLLNSDFFFLTVLVIFYSVYLFLVHKFFQEELIRI